jgi:hypothetical protein
LHVPRKSLDRTVPLGIQSQNLESRGGYELFRINRIQHFCFFRVQKPVLIPRSWVRSCLGSGVFAYFGPAIVSTFLERFIAMAMPKAQHFDNAVGFFYQVEDAIRAFEDWELLSLRVSRVAKIAASSSGAGIT